MKKLCKIYGLKNAGNHLINYKILFHHSCYLCQGGLVSVFLSSEIWKNY